MSQKPYAFISYCHRDNDTVRPLLDELEARGLSIWYDDGIEVGSEWPEYIATSLENASCVIAFMTPNAVHSHNCRREINYAIEQGLDIVVAYLEPTELSAGMRLQLNTLQAIFRENYSSDDDFIETLLRATILQDCLETIDESKGEQDKEQKQPSETKTTSQDTNHAFAPDRETINTAETSPENEAKTKETAEDSEGKADSNVVTANASQTSCSSKFAEDKLANESQAKQQSPGVSAPAVETSSKSVTFAAPKKEDYNGNITNSDAEFVPSKSSTKKAGKTKKKKKGPVIIAAVAVVVIVAVIAVMGGGSTAATPKASSSPSSSSTPTPSPSAISINNAGDTILSDLKLLGTWKCASVADSGEQSLKEQISSYGNAGFTYSGQYYGSFFNAGSTNALKTIGDVTVDNGTLSLSRNLADYSISYELGNASDEILAGVSEDYKHFYDADSEDMLTLHITGSYSKNATTTLSVDTTAVFYRSYPRWNQGGIFESTLAGNWTDNFGNSWEFIAYSNGNLVQTLTDSTGIVHKGKQSYSSYDNDGNEYATFSFADSNDNIIKASIDSFDGNTFTFTQKEGGQLVLTRS